MLEIHPDIRKRMKPHFPELSRFPNIPERILLINGSRNRLGIRLRKIDPDGIQEIIQ